MVAIYVSKGSDAGITFELDGDEAVVGRSKSCDIVLTDPSVSRQHLHIALKGQEVSFKNLSRTKVPLLNGDETGEGVLSPSDSIQLGATTLVLSLDGQEDETAKPGDLNEEEEMRLASLYELSDLRDSSMDLSMMLGIVLENGLKLFEAPSGHVILFENEDASQIRQHLSLIGGEQQENPLLSAEQLAGFKEVLEKRKSKVAFRPLKEGDAGPLAEEGLGGYMMIPLFLAGKMCGVVYLLYDEAKAPAALGEEGLVKSYSQLVMSALGEADLFREAASNEREAVVYRQVQDKLMPGTFPKIGNLENYARFEAAEKLGGDYYDMFRRPDGTLGFFMADVSSKGLPGAVEMVNSRGILRTCLFEAESPLDAMLTANRLLTSDFMTSMFVRVAYIIVDRSTRVARIVNAGYNPPLYYASREKRTGVVESSGMAIGLDKGDVFKDAISEDVLEMAVGDILFFCSDGVLRGENTAGEEYGEERIAKFVNKAAGSSCRQLVDSLITDLDTFLGAQASAVDKAITAVKVG